MPSGYFGFDESSPGSPSAARSYDQYAAGNGGPSMGPIPGSGGPGTDVLSRILASLFGGRDQGRITSEPLPPPSGYQAQPSWSPPPAPSMPPATKLSSASNIAERIGRMLAPPSPPPEVTGADFTGGVPYDPYGMPPPPTSADFTGGVPYDPYGAPPPPTRADFTGIPIPPRPPGSQPLPSPPQPRQAGWGNGWFGPARRAMGGPIEMMRGGYPELYDEPVRSGYFSTGGGSNYVEPDGMGDGRSDHIEARLSPGEFVIESEIVSMLGDGDNDAGARKLDSFRANIRKHKGKKLAEGKFSPSAKAPEEYLVGNPLGDGLRRRGRERE